MPSALAVFKLTTRSNAWVVRLASQRGARPCALGARARAGRLSTVCLIGSRLFCLRVEPSLDLVKVAKMYQAVLIP